MTPDELLAGYERATRRMQAYRSKRRRPTVPATVVLAITEAGDRIWQTTCALRLFMRLDAQRKQREQSRLPDELETGELLRFHAETYYYFAFRLLQLLSKQVPEFSGLKARGVRLVRNQRIEHPDKPGGVMATNYTYDVSVGFIIKPWGGRPSDPAPRGLYPDAEELLSNLSALLDAAGIEKSNKTAS